MEDKCCILKRKIGFLGFSPAQGLCWHITLMSLSKSVSFVMQVTPKRLCDKNLFLLYKIRSRVPLRNRFLYALNIESLCPPHVSKQPYMRNDIFLFVIYGMNKVYAKYEVFFSSLKIV